jgi:hypothetical protein
MNPSEINVSKITIEKGLILHDGQPMQLKTDWTSAFYNNEFETTINCPIKKDDNLFAILKRIDELVKPFVPAGVKQIVLLKSFVDKEGHNKFSVKPKINFVSIYNTNKEPVKLSELVNIRPLECRLFLTFPKVKVYRDYFGVVIACKQIQVRQRTTDSNMGECIFD